MTRTVLMVLIPNAGFEILTSYWLVITLGQHYDVIDWSDYQREKSITILKHDFCDNNYRSKNDLHRVLEVHIFLPNKNC